MLKWSFVQVLETPDPMMAKFVYLLLQHKRTKRHMVVRLAPRGSVVVVLKLSLINEVVYMQLDTLNQSSTYIILSWNSSKYLSLTTFEILAKKMLCKRNLMAKQQVLKVVSTKALPEFSGQGCPEDLWVPTRAVKRRLDGKTPEDEVERADYSALNHFHPVDADVHAAVALHWQQVPVHDDSSTDYYSESDD